MSLAYRIGHCCQCDARIMVKDTDGIFKTIKRNYAELKIEFNDGHTMRVPVCDGCAVDPDYDSIMTKILSDGSQANFNEAKKTLMTRRYENSETPRGISISFMGNKRR